MVHDILAAPAGLLEQVDLLRMEAGSLRDDAYKAELGQFFTPFPVATLMASMPGYKSDIIELLDAGAGVGTLFAACVAEILSRDKLPSEIRVTAFEMDASLERYLRRTAKLCEAACRDQGVAFSAKLVIGDFIEKAAETLGSDLYEQQELRFNCAVLNPPYRKINSQSRTRRLLREIGIETSNLYTGFLAAAIKLIRPHGELVAITPRSFCNGPYFLPFRKQLLGSMAIRRLHVFESRNEAFKHDAVLQENVILHAAKNGKPATVEITSDVDAQSECTSRRIPYGELVKPDDEQAFIHIVPDADGPRVAKRINGLKCVLEDLGLSVSTGRVVDFRARRYLRMEPENGTVPLIYPAHFCNGQIGWPKRTKKPNALVVCDQTADLLVPNGNYVLVKRFSAKEERKRIVAVVHSEGCAPAEFVGFENHLNYFHRNGAGLPAKLAKGLACFLNSTLVDTYFRQFNGHTQVNATDLRSLKYPMAKQLESLGMHVPGGNPGQVEIDALVEKEVF